MVAGMHQHRLVLNGPAAAVARLASELESAGAVAVRAGPEGPPRMVWATVRPASLTGLCAAHEGVTVGVERFELLGEELERLIVRGREATVLERRRPAAVDAEALADWGCGGLCLEEGERLDPVALRTAARRVLAVPAELWPPGPTASALDDAVLLGRAVGRLCAAASDPALPPNEHTSEAIAALAAAALTVAAGCAEASCVAERGFERAWRLTQATAHAGREELWTRRGEVDRSEWLMELLLGAGQAIEAAAACLHAPPPPFVSLHAEHVATEEEQLERAAGRLTATALQALVLFDPETERC